MRALIAAGLGALALIVAPSAAADDQAFLDVMSELGISSSHGRIGDNSEESRSTLDSGYNICRNLRSGYTVLDAQRMLFTASQTRRAMADGNPISPSQIYAMVDAAQRHLCPDTL